MDGMARQGRGDTTMRRTQQSRQEFLRDAADILQREWREYHLLKSCPVFFNITNFHLYNATHGFRQGDLCLQHIEGILQDVFPERPVLHLGADNFAVLAEEANVQARIDKACQRVQAYIGNPNIALKAGIRFLSGPRSLKDLNVAFDSEAKIACDTIKKDASRHWAIYTQELGLRHKMQNYVREYLDQALEKGFIRLYLQPIIRTLTGKLIGAEALARWESLQYGIISPAIFIPVLEEAHLIHKLDAYILNAVAKMTRQNLDNGLPALPVSVNLSRLDFILQDPFATTEAIREKYNLPLGLLQVEVTENALVDKMEPVLDGIRRFQQGGYPVLLDDFGSGYSSLNVLKDYDFDTIKFDMKFLHPFTEKSRKILKSLVSMAKDLHIHTLAEGAETKEQCDFLREIGCEKIQGYYYGKPIPCEDFHQYALDQGLQVETRAEAQLFDQAGLIDLNQPIPVSIVRDDTQEMTMLQANGLYLESLHSIGTRDVQRVNVNLRSAYFPMNEKFRRFADRLRMTGQWETMTYVDDGQYMRLKAKEITTVDKESIYQVGLYNISAEEALDDANAHRFDRLLRNVLLTYDAIWYLNLDENLVEIIETLTSIRVGTQFHNVASALRQFASHYVHPSDRERFLTFTDPKTFYERAASNPQSFISAPFRILLADGRYGWMYFTSMALVKSTSREMLVCLCRDFMIRQPDRQTIIRQMVETYGISKEFFAAGPDTMTASIWHVLMDDLGIEFFWKDRQHRFRGASKAFLQGRGVKDVTEILGKTVDDLGWLLHTTHAQETEEKVMQTGEPQLDVQEYLSIGHRIQEIRTFEYPIRESGQVVGVFIRINSLEDAPERRKQDLSLGLIDEETGLLSYSGMLMDGLQYADEYRLHVDDYTALLLDVPEYDAIGMKYGKVFRQHLLQEIVALVRQAIPTACSLARIGNCCFLVLAKAAQPRQSARCRPRPDRRRGRDAAALLLLLGGAHGAADLAHHQAIPARGDPAALREIHQRPGLHHRRRRAVLPRVRLCAAPAEPPAPDFRAPAPRRPHLRLPRGRQSSPRADGESPASAARARPLLLHPAAQPQSHAAHRPPEQSRPADRRHEPPRPARLPQGPAEWDVRLLLRRPQRPQGDERQTRPRCRRPPDPVGSKRLCAQLPDERRLPHGWRRIPHDPGRAGRAGGQRHKRQAPRPLPHRRHQHLPRLLHGSPACRQHRHRPRRSRLPHVQRESRAP